MHYTYFVGLDVSKNFFHACLIDSSQNVLFNQSYPLDYQGISSFTKALPQGLKKSILIGIESSGCYHLNLITYLVNHNFTCVILNPILIKNFAKLSLRKTKTDAIDAKTIAIFLSQFHQKLPPQAFTSEEFKDLARERERISQEIAKRKNNLEKLVVVTFPELERTVNIYNTSILKLLEKFPSAKAIKKASLEEIENILSSQKGKKPAISAKEIKALAEYSIAQNWPAKEYILSRTIQELFFLQETLKEIEKLLKSACKEISACQDFDILLSIEGIGEITALHFLAEIQDIKRFQSYKQLIAYAGLDPAVYESGNFKGKSKISKRGNRHLRRVVWLMSINVIRHNPIFWSYFERRKRQGLPYKKAVLATAHKLLRIIYALLKYKKYFDPSTYHNIPSQGGFYYAYNFS